MKPAKGKEKWGLYCGPLAKGTSVGILWSSMPCVVNYFEPFLLSASADLRWHSQVRGDRLETRNQLCIRKKVASLLSLGKIEVRGFYEESNTCGPLWHPVTQCQARCCPWRGLSHPSKGSLRILEVRGVGLITSLFPSNTLVLVGCFEQETEEVLMSRNFLSFLF